MSLPGSVTPPDFQLATRWYLWEPGSDPGGPLTQLRGLPKPGQISLAPTLLGLPSQLGNVTFRL